MKRAKPPELPEIIDEPGMAERFQRGLQRALNMPAQHRTKRTPKPKERPPVSGALGARPVAGETDPLQRFPRPPRR
jgi:hypothetical protein